MIRSWLESAPRAATICALISVTALLFSAAAEHPHALDPAWIAVILCGAPILYTSAHSLLCARKVRAELLVSAALIGALAVGEYLAAGGAALIMQFGTMLQEQVILRAQRSVNALHAQENAAGTAHTIDTHATSIVQATERTASRLILLAFVLAGAIWWGTGDFDHAVATLVVFCPCAFVHAAPMAISAAIGSLAQHGILLRTSCALERLSRIENIVFTPEAVAPGGYMQTNAAQLTAKLRRMGLHPILLAPAGAQTAAQIAAQAGIRDIRTALPPPNDPFAFSTALIRRGEGGCDPAPADCLHISIGGTADDTAADIIYSAKDLSDLPVLILTTRRMRQKIEQNALFGLTLNFIALGLAACGWLTPLTGAVWHNAAAIFIVLNAAFLTASADREKKFAFSTSL